MTKLIIALMLLFCVYQATAQSYSTNFTLTENPISEGGKWINGKLDGIAWNNVQTNGSGAFAAAAQSNGKYDDCIAHINPTFMAFNANQYAQGTVYRAAGYMDGHEIELHLRFSTTANNARGYEIYWSTNTGLYIVRWNGPRDSFEPLVTTSVTAVDGDVLRAEIIGTRITVYRNGTQVLATNDATYSTGQPGIGFCPYPGNTHLTSYGWKNYQAGSLGTGVVLKPELSKGNALTVLPNPFSEWTKLGIASGATINIFDLQGRLVKEWGPENAQRTVIWDGKDLSGKPLACGRYVLSHNSIDGSRIESLLKLR